MPVLVQGKGVPLQRQHQVLPKFRQTRFTLQAYNENPQIDSWFYCCTLNYDYKRRQAYTAAFAVEGRKAYILFSLNPIEYYASFYVPISSDEQNVGHQR